VKALDCYWGSFSGTSTVFLLVTLIRLFFPSEIAEVKKDRYIVIQSDSIEGIVMPSSLK
jgi:hypothetical protein